MPFGLGDLFGGGDNQQETKIKLPKYLEDYMKQLTEFKGQGLTLANDIYQLNREYMPYPESRIAGFTPDQTAAFDIARQQPGGDWLDGAGAGLSSIAGGSNIIRNSTNYLDSTRNDLDRAVAGGSIIGDARKHLAGAGDDLRTMGQGGKVLNDAGQLVDQSRSAYGAMDRGANMVQGVNYNDATRSYNAMGRGADMIDAAGRFIPQAERGYDAAGRTLSSGVGLASLDPTVVGNRDMITQLMNPYTDQVIDRATADIERSGERQRLADQARASKIGGSGGARHGVVDALREEGTSRNVGDVSAQLRKSGYDTALGAVQGDLDRRLQAGSTLGELASRGGELARGRESLAQTQGQLGSAYADVMAGQGAGLRGISDSRVNQGATYADIMAGKGAGLNSAANTEISRGRGIADIAAGQLAGRESLANTQAGIGNMYGRLGLDTAGTRADIARTEAGIGQMLTGAGTSDINARMGLAGLNANLQNQWLQNMLGIGGMQQGLDQRSMDLAYGDFLEQRGWPVQMYNFLNAVGNDQQFNPAQFGTTQTTTNGGGGGVIPGLAGLGLAGVGLWNMSR